MKSINTEKVSLALREKAINIEKKAILITNFNGTEQEKDFTDHSNCLGFGRVRHFNLDAGIGWVPNPLPISPANKALGIGVDTNIRAQVFQSSVCCWRCWFCFVDYRLLVGNSLHASFLTCDEMVDLYLNEDDPPNLIDLTGGQPDLTPEWVPWMMQVLIDRGIENKIFLWSDDNLSNDFLFRFLSNEQIDTLSSYRNYSRVCCFKGIDEQSFSDNTRANPKLFVKQFEICRQLLQLNLDIYCYVILTSDKNTKFDEKIPRFMDAVQNIDEMLLLRMVPLRVFKYTPLTSRLNKRYNKMFGSQFKALLFWQKELERRYNSVQLKLPITDVLLKKH